MEKQAAIKLGPFFKKTIFRIRLYKPRLINNLRKKAVERAWGRV